MINIYKCSIKITNLKFNNHNLVSYSGFFVCMYNMKGPTEINPNEPKSGTFRHGY
jgi:hypothetical protein